MKKASVRIIAFMSVLCISPFISGATGISVAGESGDVATVEQRRIVSDDEQDRDKLYMGNDRVYESPIALFLSDERPGRSSVPTDIDLSYSRSFEKSISAVDANAEAVNHADRYARYWNETETRQVSLDRQAYELLVSFTQKLFQPYVDKRPVDLAEFFDTSTKERVENLSLIENFAYFSGVSFSTEDPVALFEHQLDVRNVITVEEGFYQVDFRLLTTFDQGTGQGIDHTAYLAQCPSGYKLVKYWLDDENFPTFIKYYQKKIDTVIDAVSTISVL